MDVKKRRVNGQPVYSGIVVPANPVYPLLRFSVTEKDKFFLRGFTPRNRLLVHYKPTKDMTRAKILDILEE